MTRNFVTLFNYGGGMRGLIPAHFMSRLEDVTGLRMIDMVDLFTGPSTGAILNAALNVRQSDHPSQPRFRARHMVRFYEREGIKIFPPDQFRELRGLLHDFNNRLLKIDQFHTLMRHGHYDPTHLSRSLKALYGDAKLSDSLRSLIVPCYNIDGKASGKHQESGNDPGGHSVWLKNIQNPAAHASPAPDVSLYDAIMASCAAPTYFPCHHFDLLWPGDTHKSGISAIDGNMFDNPCVSYYGAIKQHIPASHNPIMIVLGTGHTNKSIKQELWNRFGPLGVVDPANDLPLINVFFHSSESALMNGFRQELGDNLFTFNRPMIGHENPLDLPSTQIDDATPENLKRLRDFAEAMMEEHKDRFDQLCHILVNRRDQRQEEQESMLRRTRKYFSFFQDLRGHDRTAVHDHEADR